MRPSKSPVRLPVLLFLALGTACADATPPTAPGAIARDLDLPGQGVFHRYVAIGTSVSMGVQSDGVFEGSQRTSWPAQLAALGGRQMTQPYIQAPGCGAPLAAPLASGVRVDGQPAGAARSYADCAPLAEGSSLPAQNVAVDGATTYEALFRVPAISPVTLRDGQYARVLPPGETQVSAMIAQNPKLVSVELGANELLGARSGIWLSGVTVVPIEQWKPLYLQVLDAVESTAKYAVLVGLIDDAMDFPSFRTGQELWDARATFLPFNVAVAKDCGMANRGNVLFVAVRVPVAVAHGVARAKAGAEPYTLSCANAPSTSGIQDYVLAPEEIAALNAQLAEMDAFITHQAQARGFAHFRLNALYGEAMTKPPFSAIALMTSPQPYGPYVSLDGFHPSAEGSRVLADAAAQGLNDRYGFDLPLSTGIGGLLAGR